MPKGRMLNKKISQDEKVAKLSLEATLLYTWCIPYLDVKGRIYGDVWTLKAVVPHIKEITPEKIEECILEWVKQDLVISYGDTHKYLEFKGFTKNQTVREDRETESTIPTPDLLLSNSNTNPAQVNTIQYNISKDIETFFSYYCFKTNKTFKMSDARVKLIKARLKDYPLEELKKAVDNFVLDTWEDRKKYMDLVYCIGIRGKVDNLERWLNNDKKDKWNNL